MLGISYREHKTNENVWQQVNILAGDQEPLLSSVKHRKLSWFGHVCRHHKLPNIIQQEKVVVAEEDCVNRRATTSRSVIVVVAAHRKTEVDGQLLQRRRLSEYPQRCFSVTGVSQKTF